MDFINHAYTIDEKRGSGAWNNTSLLTHIIMQFVMYIKPYVYNKCHTWYKNVRLETIKPVWLLVQLTGWTLNLDECIRYKQKRCMYVRQAIGKLSTFNRMDASQRWKDMNSITIAVVDTFWLLPWCHSFIIFPNWPKFRFRRHLNIGNWYRAYPMYLLFPPNL